MGQSMTTTRIAITIVLFAAAARGAVVVGDKPTLRVHTIDGTTFDLKDYKGKLVLVDFFFGRSDLDRAYHQHLLDLHNRQNNFCLGRNGMRESSCTNWLSIRLGRCRRLY